MKKGILLILLAFGLVVQADAQLYPKTGENFKLGIRTGAGFTTLTGSALTNNTVKYGFNGGIYYRQPLGNGRLHMQADVAGAFRGSNFGNDEDDEYYRISTFYIDVQDALMIDLTKDNEWLLVAGGQVSFLANATVFVNPNVIPEDEDPTFQPMDYFAVLGVHRNTYYAGFRLSVKYGLTNINDGVNFIDFGPPVGSGDIRNFCVELNVYF